jgi:hypothetical protein
MWQASAFQSVLLSADACIDIDSVPVLVAELDSEFLELGVKLFALFRIVIERVDGYLLVVHFRLLGLGHFNHLDKYICALHIKNDVIL